MWTLKICTGMFMALCGQLHFYAFDSREECREEAEYFRELEDTEYAVCFKTGDRTDEQGVDM